MKILVANLGSTSFKYQLLDMNGERQLARGGIERIGSPESRCSIQIGGRRSEKTLSVPDHAEAVRQCLAQLTDPQTGCLADASEVSAIGFKAVFGGRVDGVRRVDAEVLDAMEEVADIAPAHNPPYIRAMRLLNEKLPQIPLVAAFETDFHCTIPPRNRLYAVPQEWAEKAHVRRWGYHGASHRYIATRTAEILGRGDLRVISCHLGGSSSLCAIKGGQSVACSLGMSPQTGLPHNNRVGDFDPFALPRVMKHTGKSLEEVLTLLASQCGLAGLSGTSGDMRDLAEAAQNGSDAAPGPGTVRFQRTPLARRIPRRTRRRRRDRLHRRHRREPVLVPHGSSPQPRRTGHSARLRRQRASQGRNPHPRRGQPGEDLGRAHQRRTRRRTPRPTPLGGPTLMFVAKVTGSLVSTQKTAAMVGYKLLVVEPYRLDDDRHTLRSAGRTFVAVDTVGAGEGEYVLVTQGSSARLTPETENLPVDTVIIGIVDSVHVDQSCVYSKQPGPERTS